MDYRKRMYDAYVSTHLKHIPSLTDRGYEHLAKVSRCRLTPFLPEDKDARIIDLACGSGHFLYFFQKKGYSQAQGIDISQEQVDLARRMGVRNVEVGDLFEVLPLCKEEFDFILASHIIEHLRKDEILEFLDLVYAALKPGACALVRTLNAAALFGARVASIDFTHETAFTLESLSQIFHVAGFECVEVYGEEPVVHSLGSAVRAILWKLVKATMKAYLLIDGSIGFGIWKTRVILEPLIFVVGRKPRG